MPNDKSAAIYTQDMTPDVLQDLLCADLKWAYVSQLVAAQIEECTPDLAERWPQGRAFGPKREVRWQKTGDHYHVDVLTEEIDFATADWEHITPDINGLKERAILLWGELGEHPDSPEEWIEVRIPQPLHYPVCNLQRPSDPQSERALLRVVIQGYDYTVDNIPVATRWAVLEQDRPSRNLTRRRRR